MNLLKINEKRVCFMKRRLVSLVTAICVAAPIVAVADTLTWNGGASGNFSTGPWTSDGSHTTPENGDTLVFGTVGDFNNDIADLSVAGISITASGAVRINGSQITLAGGGSLAKSGSGVYTNNVPLVLGTAAGQTVYVEVASGCTIEMSASISGDANLVYGNTSTSTGRVNLRNNGSDYTGTTTARRGSVYVYSNDAFGSADGGTTLSGAANNALKVYFQGVTMGENFTVVANASDTPNNSPNYPVNFPKSNTFNGTWSVSGNGYFYNSGGTTTFNGRVAFSTTHFFGGGSLVFNGEGSTFANDVIYGGGTITYGAKCKYTGTLTVGRTFGINWIDGNQRRNFNCENAILYDESAPAALSFARNSCTSDMRGYDQTFSVITCGSSYSGSVVTSTDPSTIHLTLPGSSAANCYAKFTGQVSLSFEGSRPISLGNTASTSTGSLSLTNAAAVTLLDGFKWGGMSVTVAGDSTLTVGNVIIPTETVVTIRDESAHSTISLDSGVDLSVEALRINGVEMARGKTYGASGSGADVIDDDHFSGSGVLRVLAGTPLTLTWTGGSSGNLSSGSWSGGSGSHTTPLYGDTLVFSTPGDFNNDISGLVVAGLSVTATGGVRLNGNQIALMSGATISKSGSGTYTNNVPLVLGTASGQTVYVEVASGCTIEMLAAISGDANLVYGNTSTSTGIVNLRNDGSDYTGTTTAKRGTIYVYSNDAFGSTTGGTTLSGAAQHALKVTFAGVTMDENVTASNNASDTPNNWGNYPITFSGSNTFNGTWSVSGYGYINSSGTTTFNGRTEFSRANFFGGGGLVFNGEGSTFANDVIYGGGTITYGAKCKYTGTLTVGRTFGINWIDGNQRRYFNCENAILYDETAPAALSFARNGCTSDMRGYDQTFSVITCDSSYSGSVVTSTDPSTIHLTLPGSSAANCYAKFTGQVSLSFEGSQPISLGNTASTSTGSLSLTNAAAVTLLDGFKWGGSCVTVADGSTLTVGGSVALPETLAVAISDRDSSTTSKIVLNANAETETLAINGKVKSGGKTYGATGSGADVVDDDHFGGTGVLRVRKPCGFVFILR